MSGTSLEIKIDQPGVAMTKGEETTKDNPLQGQKESEVPLEDEASWFTQLMPKDATDPKIPDPKIPKPKGPKFPKVSRELSDNRECYNPVFVSIGPYHRSDRNGKLSDAEKLKERMTREFVEACEKNMLKELYPEVKRVAQKVRTFYDERIIRDITNEEFMKMMFIDGCFILQFIDCIHYGKKLEMTDEQVGFVERDLLLLENQLPFPVLTSLMNVRYKSNSQSKEIINSFLRRHIFDAELHGYPMYINPIVLPILLPILLPIYLIACIMLFVISIIMCLIGFIIGCFGLSDKISHCYPRPDSDQPPEPQRKVEKPSGEDNQHAHLLDLVYSQVMGSKKLIHGKTERRPDVSSGHYLYYSAKNLRRVGIHFQAIWNGGLTDVKFKSSIFFGTLELPRIVVNESTESLLLNLAAYEESVSPDQLWVASYICFMDSFINDAKDVEELRSKGIIANYLGEDQKVADLFNEMGKHLKPDASTYNDVKRKINEQCGNMFSQSVALWQQEYFRGPWTIIGGFAGASGLGLMAAQTYFTRYPPGK